ncbi:hypothetical protein OIO90_001869 [Microbotryomycetes sp. JL221]|nr:hypothetical protein OIO90_001869 [Microbotryomycetes sp. JL221]
MSSEEAASAAERKAAQAARQAKLLAKSQQRLAKITGAAPDGRVPNDASLGIPSRPSASSSSSATTSASKAGATSPPAPTSLLPDDDNDDPAEIDLAQHAHKIQSRQLTDTFGTATPPSFVGFGQSGSTADAGSPEDMLNQLMAQLTGNASSTNGAQQNPFMGTNGGSAPNPFASMMNAQGQPQPPMSPFPPQPKTLLDRVFPLIHFMTMIGLAWYSVAYLEPANKIGVLGWTDRVGRVDWKNWGSLASQRPAGDVAGHVVTKGASAIGAGLAQVPLLWIFVSVELVLQTTRMFLVRNQPEPPGIINSILPILSQFSPQLGLMVQTGIKYLALVSVLVTDLSVLVFAIGVIVIVGRWKTGAAPLSFDQVVEVGHEAWHKVGGEL